MYGKIKTLTKTDGTTITYTYDAAGNRIGKAVTKSGITTTTWYVRDAQGSVMAMYMENTVTLRLTEQHLYGSSRLGILGKSQDMDAANLNAGNQVSTLFTRGMKSYELTNHLGNVLVTVSDKRQAAVVSGGNVTAYLPVVVSAGDNYAFGMQMPQRSFSASTYRYGFNGKEKDNEVKGDGNQIDYGWRIHDPRIGRFLSTDPLEKKYPELTPYQFASNRPIDGIDQDGLEFIDYLKGQQARYRLADMQAKTNAVQLKQNQFKAQVAVMLRQAPPPPTVKQMPNYTPQQKAGIEAFRKQDYNKQGLNEDGTPSFTTRLAENKTWKNFADNIALPMVEMATVDGAGKILKGSTETFYRAMSENDFSVFVKTGKIPATGETMVSPTAEFAKDYRGVLVKINTKEGTAAQLQQIGVRNLAEGHPNSDLPLVQTVENWSQNNAYFKLETNKAGLQQVNIGLGKGKALETFNNNIKSYNVIGQK